MFPGIFEWVWDPGHVIFMGIVCLVLIVLVSGIIYVLGKTAIEVSSDDKDLDIIPNGFRRH